MNNYSRRKLCIVCQKELDLKNKRRTKTCGVRCSRVYTRIYCLALGDVKKKKKVPPIHAKKFTHAKMLKRVPTIVKIRRGDGTTAKFNAFKLVEKKK